MLCTMSVASVDHSSSSSSSSSSTSRRVFIGRPKTIVTKRRCLTQTKTFSVAVEILPVQCPDDAVPLANCSRDVDQRPQNFCHRDGCLFDDDTSVDIRRPQPATTGVGDDKLTVVREVQRREIMKCFVDRHRQLEIDTLTY